SGGERVLVRAELPIEIEVVAPFEDAPAKVVARADEKDLLPQILAVVADPDVPCRGIDVQLPWVAETVGVGLGDDVLLAEKWIVLGDAVLLAIRRMIDVDSLELGEVLGQILAG